MSSDGRRVPLSDRYVESPLWWDDARFPESQGGDLPAEVDVVVVGAGYTGSAAALALSRAGRRVLVLDRAPLGQGASGRNAGMVHAGLRLGPAALARRHGSLGSALHQVSLDAYRFVQRTAAEVAPDAGFTSQGWLHLAHSAPAMRRLRESEAGLRAVGERTEMLEPPALGRELRCRGFHGALLSDNGAGIQPARYLAGLMDAAAKAGATVMGETRVTAVRRRGADFAVSAARQTVRAGEVLVATNGYTDSAFPALRRRVIPIGSYIIATEPLDAALAATVTSAGRMLSDTRNFLHYWRLSPERRLVFGGRTSFTPISLGRARDSLYAAMLGIYPQLAGVRVSHAWTGSVGFTFDRLPHMGRVDGVRYAMGYCGSGVALGSWFGTLAAAWIATDASNPFLELPFRTVPGYTGRPWFLPAVGWYYQLRDRLR